MAHSYDAPEIPKDSPQAQVEAPSPSAQRRLDALLASIEPPKTRYGRPVPKCWAPMQNQPLRHPRKLRVVTIGAAISAMNMAYEIQYGYEKLGTEEEGTRGKLEDMVEHCIYDSNDDLGGTWLVNTYPGVACDVPAHIYTCEQVTYSSLSNIILTRHKFCSSPTRTGAPSTLVVKRFVTTLCELSRNIN